MDLILQNCENTEKEILQNVPCHAPHEFSEEDIFLFKQGSHFQLYNKLGAHITEKQGVNGVHYAVWAPNAKSVSVIGDFNRWDKNSNQLVIREDGSGIWEGFVPNIGGGARYKYHIVSRYNNYNVDKKDPFAFYSERPPRTASIVWDLKYNWHDQDWMKTRKSKNAHNAPISIFEVHLGSWRRVVEENNRFMTYRELAQHLVDYVRDMGFSHVEFMPVMEHPFYGSWGYQTLGYFAPSNRYGSPQDFMYLIDCFHQNNIGVILDWVPSHFPSDEHGLSYFDGTNLYEHNDPQKGFHPDWKCNIFNNGRNEVKEFLISSAHFWLDKYHVDGLRVDAVASMLYLDYSRKDGEWAPNIYGGRDNIESIDFIRRMNEVVYKSYPDIQMIAEESTAWSMVSRPTDVGGLGFGMKWNMGWMHDTLVYMSKDPIYRKYHHNELTFSMLYAYTENFVLSLSHDEVVHGKNSLVNKMPCDDWQRLANLRLLYSYMYGHPGKKLLFMGSEFAQWKEWDHDKQLDWDLLNYDRHKGIQKLVRDLNNLYRKESALYKLDFEPKGHEWIDAHAWENSMLSFIRKNPTTKETILVVCNFTPSQRIDYKVAVPFKGYWKEILNSDAKEYGGSGFGNLGGRESFDLHHHGRKYCLHVNIPPLGVLFFKYVHPVKDLTMQQAKNDEQLSSTISDVENILLENKNTENSSENNYNQ